MCLGTCTKVKEDIRCSPLSRSTLFPWDRVVSEHGDLLADGLCPPQHWGHRCPWPHLTLYVGDRDIGRFPMLCSQHAHSLSHLFSHCFDFLLLNLLGGGLFFLLCHIFCHSDPTTPSYGINLDSSFLLFKHRGFKARFSRMWPSRGSLWISWL